MPILNCCRPRLELSDKYAELLGLEGSLNEARSELERARTSWDCLRYKLRLLEVQRALGGRRDPRFVKVA